ncbi:ABC transporter ATP-binding protein [Nocardia sp. CA-128927]|uniref:ABC transporter ATP-binding protein n=1 Tax=Nocardia sp. CA-128927 TaxID=3239975 RepID=UPI003D99A198
MTQTVATDAEGSAVGRGQLAAMLRPVRGLLVGSIALQLIAAVATIVSFIGLSEILTDLVRNGAPGGIPAAAWVVVIAGFVVPAAHGLSFALSFAASRRVEFETRRDVVAHLQRIPLGWFTEHGSARVRKTVGADIASLSALVGETIPILPRLLTTTVLATGYLVWVDWQMALVVLIPAAVATVLLTRQRRNATPEETEHEDAARLLAARTTELAQGISVFKMFGQAERGTARFDAAADRFAETYLRAEAVEARRSRATTILSSWLVTIVVTAVVGTAFTAAGWIDGVDVVPFLLLSWIVSRGTWSLPLALQVRRRSRAVAAAVGAIFAEPVLPAAGQAAEPVDSAPAVEFADVRFGYRPDAPVLHGIDLRLAPGTVTALVGASGSGKSTLARLLPRFWDVDGGAISVHGRDIRGYPAEQLYRHIAFVFQEPQLLRRSIADNIRLGRPDADAAAIAAAARLACIDTRIEELPRGYDSVVGVDAVLSGGETQRVAIARAILADAPILVLDEATASADPESAAQIHDALSSLMADKTILVIAHQLPSIVGADQIVVLHEGRIEASGTHAELLVTNPRYARMWAAATGGEPTESPDTGAELDLAVAPSEPGWAREMTVNGAEATPR